jgi:DNA modification methylase
VLRAGGGRRFIGCDISAQTVRVARRRIAEEAKAGRRAVPEAVDEEELEMATV